MTTNTATHVTETEYGIEVTWPDGRHEYRGSYDDLADAEKWAGWLLTNGPDPCGKPIWRTEATSASLVERDVTYTATPWRPASEGDDTTLSSRNTKEKSMVDLPCDHENLARELARDLILDGARDVEYPSVTEKLATSHTELGESTFAAIAEHASDLISRATVTVELPASDNPLVAREEAIT